MEIYNKNNNIFKKINAMPFEIIIKIYNFDDTYYNIFKKVIKEIIDIKIQKNLMKENLHNIKYFMKLYYLDLESNYTCSSDDFKRGYFRNYKNGNKIGSRFRFSDNFNKQYNYNILLVSFYHIIYDIPFIIDY